MAFEQYFSQEWKQIPPATETSENLNGCFDCNICLDFAQEPVVTLCGHLYCWSCIYKWLHVQSASLAHDEHPQCPVCKADISHTTMIPLYGRGHSDSELTAKTPSENISIPPRPPASSNQALQPISNNGQQQLPYRNPYQNQNFNLEEDSAPSMLNLGGSTVNGVQHPVVGMFGEMVYARVFGNSQSLYAYPNSYYLMMGGGSPRLRRQGMQVDKSLNRISIFLFCCFLLCLVVF